MRESVKQHLKEAFARGYRVSVDGYLINQFGKAIVGSLHRQYIRFNLRLAQDVSYRVNLHHLAAYQKYKGKIFKPGAVIYHANRVTTDNTLMNVKLAMKGEEPKFRKYSKKHKGDLREDIEQEYRRRVAMIESDPDRKARKL